MKMDRRNLAILLGVFVFVGTAVLVPRVVDSYVLVWLFLLAVYVTLALSYDIVGGYMGYLNLGHCTFFGIGAYSCAILLNSGFGLVISLIAAAAVPATVAATVAFPLFRLRGAYFALAGFGLLGLTSAVCTNLRDLTGGADGISTPPGDHLVGAYYLSAGVALATAVLSYHLAQSTFGLALFSIREDEDTARDCGVATTPYKCATLILSAIPAGLVGGIYAWNLTYINPSAVFGLEIALSPIVMAMLGGSGTLLGPLVGAVFLTLVQEFLWTQVPYFHLTLYGAIMILVGIFMPGGLVRTRLIRKALGRTS